MKKPSRLSKQAVVLGLAVVLAGLLAVPVFADTTFTDNTFNLGNYTQTSVFLSDPTSTMTVSQCTSCGNPGLGLLIVGNNLNASTTATGLINNLFFYDPSGAGGPITSIDASVDKDLSVNFIVTGAALGNTFRPLIYQDGVVYLAAISGPGVGAGTDTTGYNTIAAMGLTATSFVSYDLTTGTFGTANPNFNGDPMYFGLGQIFGTTVPGEVLTATYDNLSLTLHTVPEPGSLLLLGAGLAGLALLAKFRQ